MFCYLVYRHWSRHTPDGAVLEAEWNAKFAEYEKKYPEEAAELKSIATGVLPAGWEKALPVSIKFCYFLPCDSSYSISHDHFKISRALNIDRIIILFM